MEKGREKKSPQANCLIQQKVFKFHNVSKDIILGYNKAKKVAIKKTKCVPCHTISGRKDDLKEKRAQSISKHCVPIRKKCLPVEPSQTKSNTEKVSTKLTKKSPSKCLILEINNKQSSKVQNIPEAKQSMFEPHNGRVRELDKHSFIKLVDISLLKEPSKNTGNNIFAKSTVSDETLTTIFKCNSPEEKNQFDAKSKKTQKNVFGNDEEEAPLDLSKKGQPPQPPNDEHYPLDLSNKDKKYQYGSVGEPPPLMPIQRIPQNVCDTFTPVISTAHNLQDSNKRVGTSVKFQSNEQTKTLNNSNNPSPNKENLVSHPILNLQPIPLVFTTNPVLHAMQTQTVCEDPIVNTDTPSPTIQNVPNIFTKELIRTKLIEISRNKPSPESQIPEAANTHAILVQPIQMVFTGGQFVQVLPSQDLNRNVEPVCTKLNTNIDPTKTDQIEVFKKTRNKRYTEGEMKGSLTTISQPQPQTIANQNENQNKRLNIENMNAKSHKHDRNDNNNDTTKVKTQNPCKIKRIENTSLRTPVDMVKTNEMVTSNGGVFCTFKNVKRIKMLKMETKTKRQKAKPEQTDVIN